MFDTLGIDIPGLLRHYFIILGTIGGWLSLLDGFSLVSLAELIFFLGWLTLKIMFKRSMEKKKTPSYLLQGGKIPII